MTSLSLLYSRRVAGQRFVVQATAQFIFEAKEGGVTVKKMVSWLLMVLMLFGSVASASATTLSFSPGVNMDDVASAFLQAHPGVELVSDGIWYETTSELAGAMLTRSFQGDIVALHSDTKDLSVLYEHGYCVDLSSSSVIAGAIARMHPVLARQVTFDGGIYGVPTMVSFHFQVVNAAAWEACGYTEADVPQSFPELLAFLDAWCDRLETEGNALYRSFGGFDMFYSPTSYTELLLEYLVDEVVLQSGYANTPVSFDQAGIISLVEECRRVGARLYETEAPITSVDGGGTPLFTSLEQKQWPDRMEDVVFFRLDESQPQLIPATLGLMMLYAGAADPSLGISYLEKLLETPEEDFCYDQVMLYQDAVPKIDPNNQKAIQDYTEKIDALTRQLAQAGLGNDDREALMLERETYQLRLEACYEASRRYLVSPAQLESYHAHVEQLFFPKPSIFDCSPDGFTTKQQLIQRYAGQQLTAQQFVTVLNRAVEMAQLED